ncbi:DUF2591 domain-containing protein [Pelomonas sp. V22]|uniref:phage protein NinX family protein n=1 Tax=Pelomonas sp. V22 TaxID=2822139 RepID=UPI0024A7F38C|nr:phage protein NinX family protein [Pelomonas sp. V22]MDI4633306.1 DUF2591 domain-containing protein [Pelomonas sp. V22]
MKHKVSELEGALLDAAVAKAEGLPVHPGRDRYIVADTIDTRYADDFFPSRLWEHGGPIIEREMIKIEHAVDYWDAAIMSKTATFYYQTGRTPLIAAMRAYVASKFGEEVEL